MENQQREKLIYLLRDKAREYHALSFDNEVDFQTFVSALVEPFIEQTIASQILLDRVQTREKADRIARHEEREKTIKECMAYAELHGGHTNDQEEKRHPKSEEDMYECRCPYHESGVEHINDRDYKPTHIHDSGCKPEEKVAQKWEYLTSNLVIGESFEAKDFNAFGCKGWEMASALYIKDRICFIFKRPIS